MQHSILNSIFAGCLVFASASPATARVPMLWKIGERVKTQALEGGDVAMERCGVFFDRVQWVIRKTESTPEQRVQMKRNLNSATQKRVRSLIAHVVAHGGGDGDEDVSFRRSGEFFQVFPPPPSAMRIPLQQVADGMPILVARSAEARELVEFIASSCAR